MKEHHYFLGAILLFLAYVAGAKWPVLAQKAKLA